MPKLTTGRLELKPLPANAAALLSGSRAEAGSVLDANLPEGWPEPNLLGLLRLRPPPAGADEGFGVWVMIETAGRALAGDIGFKGPPDDEGGVEIGYSVVPERRGRGYATEAAGALREWAFSQPGVRFIVACCDPGNIASIRTLERSGFERTGKADGKILWRCTKELREPGSVP